MRLKLQGPKLIIIECLSSPNYVLLGPAISVRASGQTEADIDSDDFFEYFEVLLLLFCRVIEKVLSKIFPNITHFF